MSYILNTQQADKVLGALAEKYGVYAPKRFVNQGRYSATDSIRYDKVSSASEIVWQVKSDYPAKEVINPIQQAIFYFTEDEYRASKAKEQPVLIFARPCDINAQKIQAKILAGNGGFTDMYYERMRERLSRLSGWRGVLPALGLGMLSPFCSCSIIPIMMGFLASGVPLPCCLVFLSSASALNLTALSAVFAGFPLPFALWYVGCALGVSLAASQLAGSFGAASLVHMDRLQVEHSHHHHEQKPMSRLRTALCSAGNVYRNVWLFMLAGVVCSSLLTAFASEETIRALLVGQPLALPLAALAGGVLHSDVFSRPSDPGSSPATAPACCWARCSAACWRRCAWGSDAVRT